MKPRRLAMVAGGLLVATTVGGGFVAERSGIDLTLVIDKLIAGVDDSGATKHAEALDPSVDEAGSGSEHPIAKGDRVSGALGDAGHAPKPDAHQMREIRTAHDAHEAAPSTQARRGSYDAGENKMPKADSHGIVASDSAHRDGKPAGERAGEAGHTQHSFDAAMHLLPPGEHQPWRIFRRLQHAQDRIVQGVPGSLQAYREEMARAAEEMMALSPPTWRNSRNVISAAAYVMAGGKPELSEHILRLKEIDPQMRDLLSGAFAYAKGQYYSAYNLLYRVDPQTLPISMAGQVALVKAMLMSPRDLERASGFLTQARQFAPGTLVEEAALRRIIRVEAETGDGDAFFENARAYARRFPRSVFLSDFLRNFAFGSLHLPDREPGALARDIDTIAQNIDEKAQVFLLSLVARGATVFGKFNLARDTSRKSLDLVRNDPSTEQRLKLYHAASSLNRPDLVAEASRQLADIDIGMLDVNDARLLRAARLVAEEIQKPLNEDSLTLPKMPVTDASSAISSEGTDPMTVSQTGTGPLLPIFSRSGSLLSLADQAMDW